MDAKDILSLIPDGLYDPSEIVLIGSHMDPSPSEETVQATQEASQIKDKAHRKEVLVPGKDQEALARGDMRVRSDFASMLQLIAKPAKRWNDEGKLVETIPTMALVYAYGYEGHIYRLASPRIMIVEGTGEPYEATREKDPSVSLTGQLFMWRMSKHQTTISIEVDSGDLEQLVLEANQPGNRSVTSYSAHMQMAHRGGKLS